MANRLSPVVSTAGIVGGGTISSIQGTLTTPVSPVSNAAIAIYIMFGDTAAAITSVTVTPDGGSPVAATLEDAAGVIGTDTQSVAGYRLTGSFAANTLHTIDATLGSAAEAWMYAELIENVDQTNPARDSVGVRDASFNNLEEISAVVTSDVGDLVLSACVSNGTTLLTVSGDQTDHIANVSSDPRHIGFASGASPSVDVAYTNNSAAQIAGTAVLAISFRSPESTSQTTVAPAQATLTIEGRAPLVNDFTAIVLRGTLINEAGSPLADLTNLSCLVWYNTAPAGAPDESLSSLTTNSNGSYSFALALGGLAFGEQVYRVIYRNDPPTANNCRVHSPNYE